MKGIFIHALFRNPCLLAGQRSQEFYLASDNYTVLRNERVKKTAMVSIPNSEPTYQSGELVCQRESSKGGHREFFGQSDST